MLLFIGLLIGLVLGLTGAGGSVFAVPLLALLAGFSISESVGLSLGAVAASTLYGSLRNRKSGSILWVPAAILALGGGLFAPLGQWLGKQLPESWLVVGFSVLAIMVGVRMWVSSMQDPGAAQVVRASDLASESSQGLLCRLSPSGQFELRPRCVSGLLLGGLTVGLLSGLFGVGGGFLIVPLLLLLSQISMVQAVATSLVVIAAISGVGFISHLGFSYHAFNWPAFGWLVTGGVAGMVVGQMLSRHLANARLQQVFAICLLLISSVMVLRQLL